MSYTFPQDLFVTSNGAAMCFNVERCQDAAELTAYIKYGGGCVDEGSGPFTITLQDDDDAGESSTIVSKRDVFKPNFIISSCKRKQLLPLRQFRCNASSSFSDEFNPSEILHRKINWSQAEEIYANATQRSTQQSTPPESVSNCSDVTSSKKITKALGPRSVVMGRCEFTQRERKEMVDFIVRSKSFSDLRGTALWKRMSAKFSNHTWQSLKNHFQKQILPLIHSYGLPKDIEVKFRTSTAKGNTTFTHSRAYSVDEDLTILKYVEKYGTSQLGGNVFWQNMESKNIIPGRTWHSVRQRFLKNLKGKKSSDLENAVERSNIPQSSRSQKPSNYMEVDSDSSGSETDIENTNSMDHDPSHPGNETEGVRSHEILDESPVHKARKARKLYTAASEFDSPVKDDISCTPVSVKRVGPSILECMVRKNEERAKANRRKQLAMMKKTIVGRSGDCSVNVKVPVELNASKHHPGHASSSRQSPCGGALEKHFLSSSETSNESQGNRNPPKEVQSSQDLFATQSQENISCAQRCGEAERADTGSSLFHVDGGIRVLSPVILDFVDVSEHEEASLYPSNTDFVTGQRALQCGAGNEQNVSDDGWVSDWSDDGLFWSGEREGASKAETVKETTSEPSQGIRFPSPIRKATPILFQSSVSVNPAKNTRVGTKEKQCSDDVEGEKETNGERPNESLNRSFDFLGDFTRETIDPNESNFQSQFESQPASRKAPKDTNETNHEAGLSEMQNSSLAPVPNHHTPNVKDSARISVGTQVCLKVDACIQTDPVLILYPEDDSTVKPILLSGKRSETSASSKSPNLKRVSFLSPVAVVASDVSSDVSPVVASMSSVQSRISMTAFNNNAKLCPSPKYVDVKKR